jgi:ribosomal protein L12E/L44/L45/RPP1/RPP2
MAEDIGLGGNGSAGKFIWSTPIVEEIVGANVCMEHAIYYASRGWEIFPAPPGKKKSFKSAKHSDGRNWGKTTNADEIKRDWAQWPQANIGIATGKDSGIFVVEADTADGHGVDGIAALAKLEAEHGKLPETMAAESPSGSIHRYFKYPKDVEKIKTVASEIAPGIDTRGDGGMVIAPPSMRPGKGRYLWLNNLEPADAPQWLIDLCSKGKGKSSTPFIEDRDDPNIVRWPRIRDKFDIQFPPKFQGFSDDASDYAWPPTLGMIHTALDKIDANATSRPKWIVMGYGLLDELGYDHALELFHNFSSRGNQYISYDSVKYQFDSLTKGKPTRDPATIASVFELAGMEDWREIAQAEAMKLRGINITPDAESINNGPSAQDKTEPASDARSSTQEEREQPKAKEEKAEEKAKGKTSKRLLQTSAEFVSDHQPLEYLIDEILQRRFLYSFTAPTGWGKTSVALLIAAHVAMGKDLGNIEVERGKVLFLAGENPDDVRMRWIKLCDEMKIDAYNNDVFFLPGAVRLDAPAIRKMLDDETDEHGPFALIIVDTSVAYFTGKDENDAIGMVAHAKMFRSYSKVNGNPTILVTCHPVKSFDVNNLVPRGGNAFVNEVDGNLVCLYDADTKIVTMTHHGKFRGPDFEPPLFRIVADKNCEKLKTVKGRGVWTATAHLISAEEKAALDEKSDGRTGRLLELIVAEPGISLAKMAEKLGLFYQSGKPNKALVDALVKRLREEGLVKQEARHWHPTARGMKLAKKQEAAKGKGEVPF